MRPPDCERVLANCAHGVIGTDAAGIIVHVNQRAAEIIGKPEAAKGSGLISDLLPETGKLIMETIRTGRPYLGHQVEGRAENLVVSISPIREGASVIGAACSFLDMREFEAIARKLDFFDLMDRRFETVFENSYDGIWLCDGDGRVIKINKSSEKISGIDRNELVGRKVLDIVGEGLYDACVTNEVILTKKRVSGLQTALLTGKRILCTGIPVLDRNGDVSMVVINERDLSHILSIQQQLEDMRQEKDRYRDELAALVMKELEENRIVAENAGMRQVMQTAMKFGQMDVSDILIMGESGTGKGLTAKFIHQCGRRSDKPFIQINCAAIPDSILEAELFGYEKGAFTGAKESGKPGLIELAHEGTLFLDEIGELSPAGQAKLLKYLDDHEVMRIGGTKSRIVDCVLIAATNKDLGKLAEEKTFRSDLFYRLNSLSLTLPPLRERPEDLFRLVNLFLKSFNESFGSEKTINPLTVAMMQTYGFPGNIRELRNIIKKGVVMSNSASIDRVVIESIGREVIEEVSKASESDGSISRLDDLTNAFEREIIKNAMGQCRSTRDLARYLNISQPTIVRKLKKHGLSTQETNGL